MLKSIKNCITNSNNMYISCRQWKNSIHRYQSTISKASETFKAQDYTEKHVPRISFNDLVKRKILKKDIELAFGSNGIGIIAVSDVPHLQKMRRELLPLAIRFAELPDKTKEKYVLESTCYSFGWSHGKEKLQGKPDFAKGSYYNNPQYNKPVEDESLIKKYPSFIHPNIWPSEIPELESAFMNLGQLIVKCGKMVAWQCDQFVQSKCLTYSKDKISNIIGESLSCKARLLHYYPLSEVDIQNWKSDTDLETEFSNWCGWHNDHGSLTGLVQPMYVDTFTGLKHSNPDPEAGLYVKTRSGRIIKAIIPDEHLVFQIGESAQIHSGGLLKATPHAVRGPKCTGLSRNTFAVFMEPNWSEKMHVPHGVNPFLAADTSNLPKGVPSLLSRWNNSMNFEEFTSKTLKAYY